MKARILKEAEERLKNRHYTINDDDNPMYKCLNMDNFLLYISVMPKSILSEYRQKRSYINSILSNNEVDRKFVYNKKLFKRKARGCYDINPDIVFM